MRGLRRYSAIGVDLGSRLIKAGQWVRREGRWQVHAVAALKRTGEWERDVAGLDDLLYRQGLRGRRVVLGLPRGMLHSAVLELPPRVSGAPLEQIAHAELARMHRLDPGTLCAASWDLPQSRRAGAGSGTSVMAVGCTYGDSEPVLDLFEARGFVVEAADSPSWALARGCRAQLGAGGQGAIIDFGWSGVGVCFVHGGVVVYDRNLPDLGLARLQRALCETLSLEAEAAEYLLRNAGVSGEGGSKPQRPQVPGLASAMDAQIEKVAEELRVAMDYVAHRYNEQPLAELLLVGGGAAVAKVRERLGEALDKEVRVVEGAGELGASVGAAGWPGSLWPAALGLAEWGDEMEGGA